MAPTRRQFLAILGGGMAAAGCSTVYRPMGPLSGTPGLTGDSFKALDGVRLPLRIWRPPPDVPPRAAILALHGFNDYSFCFDGPGRTFAGQGIVTYAYDQRGFGATSGRGLWPGVETLVLDAGTALALVRAAHPGLPLFLMGESMGGAVALTLLGKPEPPHVDGAIFVAPAIWGFETMDFLPGMALRLAYAMLPGLTLHPPEGLRIRPSDNIPMLRAMSRDPLVIKGARVDTLYGLTELMGSGLNAIDRLSAPSLVLYGAKEEVLPEYPVSVAIKAFARRPRCRIAVYPKGYHMLLRDLDAALVETDILCWLANSEAPLPGGAERMA